VQVRERVINRVVFGTPEGRGAVYLSRREQMESMAKVQLPPMADAWKRLLSPDTGPVRLDEEPT